MVRNNSGSAPHVFLLAYPAHGHINPMLQLACRLSCSSSLSVMFISAEDAINSILESGEAPKLPNLHFESFPSCTLTKDSSIDDHLAGVRRESSSRLCSLMKKHMPTCIIYDFSMPWVLETTRPLGIFSASFFTQSSTVYALYYLHYHDQVSDKALLELGSLNFHDFPSPLQPTNKHPALTPLLLDRFTNCSEPTWVLVNSFDELESKAVKFMFPRRALMTLGPLLPPAYFRRHGDQTSICNGGRVKECIECLDGKERGSVVYVSFGSILGLSDEQMEELAWGLKDSKRPFLWVVKTPKDKIEGHGRNRVPDGFREEAGEQGLVVPWCPQLEVLNHPAIGCFVSHCGWNSTLESLCMGVPLVAIPQWLDQPTNAKLVDDVWRVGVRPMADQRGLVSREELQRCLSAVMHGEGKGGRSEARACASQWRERARAAISEGGSSSRNFEELVSKIHGRRSVVQAEALFG
ncbi:Anthocyanidin 3-O-glucoside 5-O-glucosyltransferase [Nymphaea thermarum]|nr:Anthocyanidin 3-O-glucoside 5-O-glucosyltransferase [Nymphaea thermarum]